MNFRGSGLSKWTSITSLTVLDVPWCFNSNRQVVKLIRAAIII